MCQVYQIQGVISNEANIKGTGEHAMNKNPFQINYNFLLNNCYYLGSGTLNPFNSVLKLK